MPPDPCQWITLQDALKTFVRDPSGTQTAEHIRSLHWYIASRLVVEGGFMPETIRPRPPFKVRKKQIAKKGPPTSLSMILRLLGMERRLFSAV